MSHVCLRGRKKGRRREGERGLNRYLGVSFRCQGGAGEEEWVVLTGQSHSWMIWKHTRTQNQHIQHTHRGTRLFFCIIYEMLPLSHVLHLASTECQEKSRAYTCVYVSLCVKHTKRACVRVFIGESRKTKRYRVANYCLERTRKREKQVDIICDSERGGTKNIPEYLKSHSYREEKDPRQKKTQKLSLMVAPVFIYPQRRETGMCGWGFVIEATPNAEEMERGNVTSTTEQCSVGAMTLLYLQLVGRLKC